VDKYHTSLHLVWGAFALALASWVKRQRSVFCIASGAFYGFLAVLGLTVGTRCWAGRGMSAPCFCTPGTTSSTGAWLRLPGDGIGFGAYMGHRLKVQG